MHAWLDETCGAEGWATAPAGTTGIVDDALALYFEDPAFAHAFVARFCCGYRVETIAGALPSAATLGQRGAARLFIGPPNEPFRLGKWTCSTGPGWRR